MSRSRPSFNLRKRLLLSHLAIFAIGALCVVALIQADVAYAVRPAWVPGLLLGSILIIAFGLILSISLARRFSAPLEAVARAARDIAVGRFDTRVGPSAIPEANALSMAFNDMAEALAGYSATSMDQLMAEQRRNEAVLNCTDDGLIIVDDQARIERINPVAARQLGISAEDGIGSTLDQLLEGSAFDQLIRDSVLHGTAPLQDPEPLLLGVGDAQRELAVTLVPFHDDNRPGLVLILRDVTRERRLDRLRADFLMQASHELRTPVTTLNLTLHLLAERSTAAAGSRDAELLQSATAETDHLIDLINSLLDLSRLQGGAVTMHREDVGVDELLQAAAAALQLDADERGIALTVDVTVPAPQVAVDRVEFPRVLANLIGNALRHSDRGGRVQLQVRQIGHRVEISVSDEGEGIAAGHLARIFEPFVQVGSRNGAAGLGLTLCRELVEAHDGRLDVSSQAGKGSRFSIVLPLSTR